MEPARKDLDRVLDCCDKDGPADGEVGVASGSASSTAAAAAAASLAGAFSSASGSSATALLFSGLSALPSVPDASFFAAACLAFCFFICSTFFLAAASFSFFALSSSGMLAVSQYL